MNSFIIMMTIWRLIMTLALDTALQYWCHNENKIYLIIMNFVKSIYLLSIKMLLINSLQKCTILIKWTATFS